MTKKKGYKRYSPEFKREALLRAAALERKADIQPSGRVIGAPLVTLNITPS